MTKLIKSMNLGKRVKQLQQKNRTLEPNMNDPFDTSAARTFVERFRKMLPQSQK